MRTVPQSLQSAYREAVSTEGLGPAEMAHYEKWVRYYWDFCGKYGQKIQSGESVEAFLEKLRAKGQGAGLREQARQAVMLFRKVCTAPEPEEARCVEEAESTEHPSAEVGATARWREARERMEREILRRNYSRKTLATYGGWVRRFAAFAGPLEPEATDAETAQAFLTHLAVKEQVASSTQNQAFNALLFFFRHVLEKPFDLGDKVVRAKTKRYIPTVLTRSEVESILAALKFPFSLIASVQYGCGLRLSEALNLRVNCLDFDKKLVIIHDGKGMKDRSVPMPRRLEPELAQQVDRVGRLLARDLETEDFAGAFLPPSVARRSRNAGREFHWQWLFPAKTLTLVPEEGVFRRYHQYDTHMNRAIRAAVRKAKVPKRVTSHTFRHTFASHLLEANVDIRTIQQLLGHSDIRTTMIYTHTVPSRTIKEMVSPMDVWSNEP